MNTVQRKNGVGGIVRAAWTTRFFVTLFGSTIGIFGCGPESPVGGSSTGESSVAVTRESIGSAHTLSGNLYGTGEPLEGALIEALPKGTTTGVASSTTDATGAYSLPLGDATYDLRVTPPGESPYARQGLRDITMAGADVRNDIMFLVRGVRVTGQVRGYGGNGISGASIQVLDDVNNIVEANVKADADGRYELGLPAGGSYWFTATGSGPSANAPAESWTVQRRGVSVSPGQVVDLELPVARVQGRVTDANGAPASVVIWAVAPADPGTLDYQALGSVRTAADGRYSFLVASGPERFSLYGAVPYNSLPGWGSTPQWWIFISGDTTQDFVLPRMVLVTGHVRGYGGEPIAGATVDAGRTDANTLTGADGEYQLPLVPGTYSIRARINNVNAPYVEAWRTVAVASDTTVDLNFPFARVQGRVTDANGTPSANATVSASGSSSGDTSTIVDASALTSGDGRYSIFVQPGSNEFVVSPSGSSGLSRTVIVSGDMLQDFVLPPTVHVTGQVVGYGGVGVPGAGVEAWTAVKNASATTDASGRYQLDLVANTYTFEIFQRLEPYGYYSSATSGVVVAQNMTLDLSFGLSRVRGRAVDANGSPIANLSIFGAGVERTDVAYREVSSQVQTGADGTYSYFSVAPKTDTGINLLRVLASPIVGFSDIRHSNIDVTDGQSQVIVLQTPDPSPVITSGPLVAHLSGTSVSIEWQTSEPTDALVEYGPSGLTQSVSRTSFESSHDITLVGLQPATTYQYRVSSTDRAENRPAVSSVATFRTQASPGDAAPPVITAGPTLASIGAQSAVVHFVTNEPATSSVRIGPTSGLGTVVDVSGQFSRDHLIRVSGLSAATTYFYEVATSDPDGNGPTTSAVSSFTTAGMADTTAPEITDGPRLLAATDQSLTVVWTTNEPATSRVSYDDGSAFLVLNDDALVNDHEVTLVDLIAATSYEITVAATDASGNGPSSAEPIAAMTSALADTSAPRVHDVAVANVSSTSARVSWTTDEPATTEIAYGTGSRTPTAAEGSSRLTLAHDVLLTGLASGATYYFTLRAVDAARNVAQTPEASFMTLPLDSDHDGIPDDQDPCPTDPQNTCQATDADHDGVDDSRDRCPSSAPGAVVGKFGCSIPQLCPCAAPVRWHHVSSKHGAYVACVSLAADAFVRAGLLNQWEAASVKRNAAGSACTLPPRRSTATH